MLPFPPIFCNAGCDLYLCMLLGQLSRHGVKQQPKTSSIQILYSTCVKKAPSCGFKSRPAIWRHYCYRRLEAKQCEVLVFCFKYIHKDFCLLSMSMLHVHYLILQRFLFHVLELEDMLIQRCCNPSFIIVF